MTIGQMVDQVRRQIAATPSATPRLDAELIVSHVLGRNRTWLLVHANDALPAESGKRIDALVQRRLDGWPIAYLTGKRQFGNLELEVGPGVLVPRPETEQLVELVAAHIETCGRETQLTLIDVGTGTGAIALSLASLVNDSNHRIVASDVTASAIESAKKNAKANGSRILLVQGDLLAWLGRPADVVVANLPYLRPDQVTGKWDISQEPELALIGGTDGLELVRRLLRQTVAWLGSDGLIALELDPSNIESAAKIANALFPKATILLHADLAGNDRFLTIRKSEHDPGSDEKAANEFMDSKSVKDERLVPYGTTNLGMPLALSDSFIVPNERFFVRSNGETPIISRDEWTLTISGSVANETVITFGDLLQLNQRTYAAFLECTGNSRSRFQPEAEGTPWRNDAIGNAKWTGVALRDVLTLAGLEGGVVDVISQGADLVDMRRGLPIEIALHPDTLLVYEMNDEPLPSLHGGPVRLLVPGWAGIASTKWLIGLELSPRPFVGKYQGELYLVYDEQDTPVDVIREMPVKSLIAEPLDGAVLESKEVIIRGFAWSGHDGIASVDVSTDDGHTWYSAEITETSGPYSWCAWMSRWTPVPGSYVLQVRATDNRGLRQPVSARWNTKGYLMNAIQSVSVSVSDNP